MSTYEYTGITLAMYSEMLASSLRYVSFDKASGTLYPFENVFYPLTIGEGKYAFLSYIEQMENTGGLVTDSPTAEEMTQDRGKRDGVLAVFNALSTPTEQPPIIPPTPANFAKILPTLAREMALDIMAEGDAKARDEAVFEASPLDPTIQGQDLGEALPLDWSEGDKDASVGRESTLSHRHEVYATQVSPREPKRVTHLPPNPDEEELQNEKVFAIIRNKYGSTSANLTGTMDLDDGRDLLLVEPHRELRHSLCVPTGECLDRLIVVASAGHGKSTLLRRLAFYYCDTQHEKAPHLELQKAYGLSAGSRRIPCIIYLRNIDNVRKPPENMVVAALVESVLDVLWTGLQSDFDAGNLTVMPTYAQVRDHAKAWVSEHSDSLMLLIDGMDELPEGMRCAFLKSLEIFLSKYPLTPVIMTSRVAGLLESVKEDDTDCDDTMGKDGIMKLLRRMQFRGRSIIPLSDKSAEAYALRWIDMTQADQQKSLLREALHKVQTQRKFAYLKTFMRTPLELLSVLKQLTRDMLSLNRCEMFRDMMWHLVTNHADGHENKQALFDDTMTLLSFIAYQMQMKERLYLTQTELMALEEDFGNLLFYTEMVGEEYAEMPRVLQYLDDLAANVGIIERDERTDVVSYTFPIRSYQEYLCAYACTHLVLQEDVTPVDLLQKYMDNNHWWVIINFALSDLQQSNHTAFDVLIRDVFSRNRQEELTRTVLEANPTLTMEHAMIFCEQYFSTPTLSLSQRDLIMTCMETRSAYMYPYALSSLMKQATGGDVYVEAMARMSVIQVLGSRQSGGEQLLADLTHKDPSRQVLSALMLQILAEASFGVSLHPYMAQADAFVSALTGWQDVLSQAVTNGRPTVALHASHAWVLLCMKQGVKVATWDEDLQDEVRYNLYLAIEDAYDHLKPTPTTIDSGWLITLMDDLYVLGVLTRGIQGESVSSDVPYMAMVLLGCKQVGRMHTPLGEALRDEASKQNIPQG